MKRCFNTVIAVFVSICLIGCATTRMVAEGSQAASQLAAPGHAGLKVGDAVVLQTRAGQQLELRIIALEADALVGREGDHQPMTRVPWADVARLERVETDGAKSGALIAAVMLGLLVLAFIIADGIGDDIEKNLGSN